MEKVTHRCEHGLIEGQCSACDPSLKHKPKDSPLKRRPNKPKVPKDTPSEPTVTIPDGFFRGTLLTQPLETLLDNEIPQSAAIKNDLLCHPQRQIITVDNPSFIGKLIFPTIDIVTEYSAPYPTPLSDSQGTAYGIEIRTEGHPYSLNRKILRIPIRLFQRKLKPDETNGKRHPLWDLCHRAYLGDSDAVKELVNKYHVWAKTLKPAEYDPVQNRLIPSLTEREYKEGLLFEALHYHRKKDPLPLWIMNVPEDRSPLAYLQAIAKNRRYMYENIYRGNQKKSDLKWLISFDLAFEGEVEQVDGYSKTLAATEMERVKTLGETCRDLHETDTEELAMLKMEADSLVHRIRGMRISRDLQDVLLTIATEHGKTTFNEAAVIVLNRDAKAVAAAKKELQRKKPLVASLIEFLVNRKK